MIALIRTALGSVSPVAWLKLAIAATMAAWLGWLAYALVDDGRLIERAKASRQIETQDSKADAAERRVLDCPAGEEWSREIGKCAKENAQ